MSRMRRGWALVCALAAGCGRSHAPIGAVTDSQAAMSTRVDTIVDIVDSGLISRAAEAVGLWRADVSDYEGHDARGIPHYTTRTFTDEERRVLRQAYGIENPNRLYVSDSTEGGILKYDTEAKRCRQCFVNSYGVGLVSVRRSEESWEDVERRVTASSPKTFAGGGTIQASASVVDLHPVVVPEVARMLRDAQAVGFKLHVIATYRSPTRQAFLMAKGGNRTHTLTSSHSYGRALDIVVDDGNRGHRKTKGDWIAFRRWITQYRGSDGATFLVLGSMDQTWDWPHVEVRSERIGFRSIDDALKRGRECLAPNAQVPCDFPAWTPPARGSPR